jgi:hypothetical protein
MKEMDTRTRGPFLSCYAGILTFQVHREGDEGDEGTHGPFLSCYACILTFQVHREGDEGTHGPFLYIVFLTSTERRR